jgi:hypothetical protein
MELSEAHAEPEGQPTVDPATDTTEQVTKANKRTMNFMFGTQKLVLEELVFLGNEMLDRAQTETHLFTKFVSKIAGAHSVRDFRTMFEECSQHHLDFIRRDSERLFKHGERVIETTSHLFNPPAA